MISVETVSAESKRHRGEEDPKIKWSYVLIGGKGTETEI